jgi:hypothetical protein
MKGIQVISNEKSCPFKREIITKMQKQDWAV